MFARTALDVDRAECMSVIDSPTIEADDYCTAEDFAAVFGLSLTAVAEAAAAHGLGFVIDGTGYFTLSDASKLREILS